MQIVGWGFVVSFHLGASDCFFFPLWLPIFLLFPFPHIFTIWLELGTAASCSLTEFCLGEHYTRQVCVQRKGPTRLLNSLKTLKQQASMLREPQELGRSPYREWGWMPHCMSFPFLQKFKYVSWVSCFSPILSQWVMEPPQITTQP